MKKDSLNFGLSTTFIILKTMNKTTANKKAITSIIPHTNALIFIATITDRHTNYKTLDYCRLYFICSCYNYGVLNILKIYIISCIRVLSLWIKHLVFFLFLFLNILFKSFLCMLKLFSDIMINNILIVVYMFTGSPYPYREHYYTPSKK